MANFFRFEPYRKQLVKFYGDVHDARTLLKSFTAKLAKWRFETIWDVMWQLLRLREFCETWMRADLFGKVKDPIGLTQCVNACRDTKLWVWIRAVFQYFVDPMERIRRWGLVCSCHSEERAAAPRVRSRCVRASR